MNRKFIKFYLGDDESVDTYVNDILEKDSHYMYEDIKMSNTDENNTLYLLILKKDNIVESNFKDMEIL